MGGGGAGSNGINNVIIAFPMHCMHTSVAYIVLMFIYILKFEMC